MIANSHAEPPSPSLPPLDTRSTFICERQGASRRFFGDLPWLERPVASAKTAHVDCFHSLGANADIHFRAARNEEAPRT